MFPKLSIQIYNGKWWFSAGQPIDAYLAGQPNGDYYFELHKAKEANKTSQQQGYYYGVVIPHTFKALKEQGNEDIVLSIGTGFKHLPLTKAVVDLLLKGLWARENDCKIKSKAEFTLEEYSELIDISLKWVAKYLSYLIPPPDKEWQEVH